MTFLGALVLVGLIFVYLLPTAVALYREHSNTLGIFILNLFLGWLLVPWVIALVWSVHVKTKE